MAFSRKNRTVKRRPISKRGAKNVPKFRRTCGGWKAKLHKSKSRTTTSTDSANA